MSHLLDRQFIDQVLDVRCECVLSVCSYVYNIMYSVCGVQCGCEDSLLIIMCIIQDITDVNYEATLVPTTQPCLMECLNKDYKAYS